jgi:hypothetical protein
VITTGTLQQLVYLRGESPGTRAVIVGAEHVSFSALITLAHAGARAVAIVTEQPCHESFAVVGAAATLRFHAPLLTSTALTGICGDRRVEAVELTRLNTGKVEHIACDLVVFTADWIPDYELAVLAGAALDPATRGPAVDGWLRTTRPGLFAAGNVLHGAEPADVAALSGAHVAGAVMGHLDGEPWLAASATIECQPPLRWITPSVVAGPSAGAVGPPRGRFLLRAHQPLLTPLVELSQDRRPLWRGRLRRLGPGRSAAVPADWTVGVDPSAGPILARVVRARTR